MKNFGITIVIMFVFAGCGGRNDSPNPEHVHNMGGTMANSGPNAKDDHLFQCSMHPNIVSQKPGTCPICAMDLQPVTKIDAKGIPGRAPVELTEQQQQLINIRVAPVIKRDAAKTIRSVGIVVYDQTQVADVNARVMGWVEALYVDKPGQAVEKSQPLMAVYSPQLYSAQQEYLVAYRNTRNTQSLDGTQQILDSARKRLELWGVSARQIETLEQSGQASNTMVLESPIAGVVVEKNVFPQQMIESGARLYRIADLSKVWIEPEIYEYEVPLVQVGQTVNVQLPAYSGITFEGVVEFIYPMVDPKTRTVRIRLVFDNPDNRIKPGMYATAIIQADLGEQTLVPAPAVFETGRRSYVFTQKSPGIFVPTLIEAGANVDDYRVVISGVKAGDQVVLDGNFLLDSESQLKAAAIGSFESDEEPPAEFTGDHGITPVPLPAAAAPYVSGLLTNYVAIGNALAQDDTTGLAASLQNLTNHIGALRDADILPAGNRTEFTNHLEQIEKAARVFDASGAENARVSYGDLSQALIALTAHFPAPLEQRLYVAECPMWKKSPPRWIQFSESLANPYMGQKMLTCGEILRTIP